MKISKNEISQLLMEVRRVEKGFNRPVYEFGAYIKSEKIHLYVCYRGQGIDMNVFYGDYDSIYEFTDLYHHWTKRNLTKPETVNRIHDSLNIWLGN